MSENYLKKNRDFWNEKYIQNHTPWDINEAAPEIVKYFDKVFDKEKIKKLIAIPGCGKGHDAFYIASKNFEVYGFDFAEEAINFCNKKKDKLNLEKIHFYNTDFFSLLGDNKWKEKFDFVIEHTFYCALNPSLKEKYIETINYILKKNGKLLGLFFIDPDKKDGPPFGSSLSEIRDLFKYGFKEVAELKQVNCLHSGISLERKEYLGLFEKQ